jgi:geranylgeranyl pyrophosphate synthase
VQPGIPLAPQQRERLVRMAAVYVGKAGLTPPLSLDDLTAHTDRVLDEAGVDRAYRNYAAVLLNNEVWRDILAGIPYERRLLMLPQCLRDEDGCPGTIDEYGLLCRRCGRCPIGQLQAEAERLGYAVLTAEGTTVVTAMIASGKVEAVVGASCLSVLERVFPYMEAAAVPGIAIPLLRDGCRSTDLDVQWLWDAMYLTADDRTRRLDLDALRRQVRSWFTTDSVASVLGSPEGATEEIARDWLGLSGKRWRPFLTVCACQALQDDPQGPVPDPLRRIALAVECFHKASLVHDDIEDGDAFRYGHRTLHEAHGVPVALNVGDLLIGEGYRLIARCGATPQQVGRMLAAAADGHRRLCLGQGAELCWRRDPAPMGVGDVIDIFALKTAPAFEVALRMAAVLAGADAGTLRALADYSEAFGVAYQIRDDIHDFDREAPAEDHAVRPSVVMALAWDAACGADRKLIEDVWAGRAERQPRADRLGRILAELDVHTAARRLLAEYKDRAVQALRPLESANLKGLLRRVVGKVFRDFELPGLSDDDQRGNAPGRQAGAGPAA